MDILDGNIMKQSEEKYHDLEQVSDTMQEDLQVSRIKGDEIQLQEQAEQGLRRGLEVQVSVSQLTREMKITAEITKKAPPLEKMDIKSMSKSQKKRHEDATKAKQKYENKRDLAARYQVTKDSGLADKRRWYSENVSLINLQKSAVLAEQMVFYGKIDDELKSRINLRAQEELEKLAERMKELGGDGLTNKELRKLNEVKLTGSKIRTEWEKARAEKEKPIREKFADRLIEQSEARTQLENGLNQKQFAVNYFARNASKLDQTGEGFIEEGRKAEINYKADELASLACTREMVIVDTSRISEVFDVTDQRQEQLDAKEAKELKKGTQLLLMSDLVNRNDEVRHHAVDKVRADFHAMMEALPKGAQSSYIKEHLGTAQEFYSFYRAYEKMEDKNRDYIAGLSAGEQKQMDIDKQRADIYCEQIEAVYTCMGIDILTRQVDADFNLDKFIKSQRSLRKLDESASGLAMELDTKSAVFNVLSWKERDKSYSNKAIQTHSRLAVKETDSPETAIEKENLTMLCRGMSIKNEWETVKNEAGQESLKVVRMQTDRMNQEIMSMESAMLNGLSANSTSAERQHALELLTDRFLTMNLKNESINELSFIGHETACLQNVKFLAACDEQFRANPEFKPADKAKADRLEAARAGIDIYIGSFGRYFAQEKNQDITGFVTDPVIKERFVTAMAMRSEAGLKNEKNEGELFDKLAKQEKELRDSFLKDKIINNKNCSIAMYQGERQAAQLLMGLRFLKDGELDKAEQLRLAQGIFNRDVRLRMSTIAEVCNLANDIGILKKSYKPKTPYEAMRRIFTHNLVSIISIDQQANSERDDLTREAERGLIDMAGGKREYNQHTAEEWKAAAHYGLYLSRVAEAHINKDMIYNGVMDNALTETKLAVNAMTGEQSKLNLGMKKADAKNPAQAILAKKLLELQGYQGADKLKTDKEIDLDELLKQNIKVNYKSELINESNLSVRKERLIERLKEASEQRPMLMRSGGITIAVIGIKDGQARYLSPELGKALHTENEKLIERDNLIKSAMKQSPEAQKEFRTSVNSEWREQLDLLKEYNLDEEEIEKYYADEYKSTCEKGFSDYMAGLQAKNERSELSECREHNKTNDIMTIAVDALVSKNEIKLEWVEKNKIIEEREKAADKIYERMTEALQTLKQYDEARKSEKNKQAVEEKQQLLIEKKDEAVFIKAQKKEAKRTELFTKDMVKALNEKLKRRFDPKSPEGAKNVAGRVREEELKFERTVISDTVEELADEEVKRIDDGSFFKKESDKLEYKQKYKRLITSYEYGVERLRQYWLSDPEIEQAVEESVQNLANKLNNFKTKGRIIDAARQKSSREGIEERMFYESNQNSIQVLRQFKEFGIHEMLYKGTDIIPDNDVQKQRMLEIEQVRKGFKDEYRTDIDKKAMEGLNDDRNTKLKRIEKATSDYLPRYYNYLTDMEAVRNQFNDTPEGVRLFSQAVFNAGTKASVLSLYEGKYKGDMLADKVANVMQLGKEHEKQDEQAIVSGLDREETAARDYAKEKSSINDFFDILKGIDIKAAMVNERYVLDNLEKVKSISCFSSAAADMFQRLDTHELSWKDSVGIREKMDILQEYSHFCSDVLRKYGIVLENNTTNSFKDNAELLLLDTTDEKTLTVNQDENASRTMRVIVENKKTNKSSWSKLKGEAELRTKILEDFKLEKLRENKMKYSGQEKGIEEEYYKELLYPVSETMIGSETGQRINNKLLNSVYRQSERDAAQSRESDELIKDVLTRAEPVAEAMKCMDAAYIKNNPEEMVANCKLLSGADAYARNYFRFGGGSAELEEGLKSIIKVAVIYPGMVYSVLGEAPFKQVDFDIKKYVSKYGKRLERDEAILQNEESRIFNKEHFYKHEEEILMSAARFRDARSLNFGTRFGDTAAEDRVTLAVCGGIDVRTDEENFVKTTAQQAAKGNIRKLFGPNSVESERTAYELVKEYAEEPYNEKELVLSREAVAEKMGWFSNKEALDYRRYQGITTLWQFLVNRSFNFEKDVQEKLERKLIVMSVYQNAQREMMELDDRTGIQP